MSWFDQTLAGMEAARLNTLHLHLSDFCRFALDLPEFPQARAPQGGGLMYRYANKCNCIYALFLASVFVFMRRF